MLDLKLRGPFSLSYHTGTIKTKFHTSFGKSLESKDEQIGHFNNIKARTKHLDSS